MFSSGVGCIICLPVSFTLSVGWQQLTHRAVCFPSVEVSLEDWFFCRDCGGMSNAVSGRQSGGGGRWRSHHDSQAYPSTFQSFLTSRCSLCPIHDAGDMGMSSPELKVSEIMGLLIFFWKIVILLACIGCGEWGAWAISSSRWKLLCSWFVLWVYCVTDWFRLFAILGSYSYLPVVFLGISCQQRTF